MKFSLATILFAAAAVVSAVPQVPQEGVSAQLEARQNQNRPTPNGQCCVANTSLKQDTCFINGQQGRCVPGGNNCGSRLSCVAQSNLGCDNGIIERGKNLCRARANGGFIDGAGIIQSLRQAKVN